MDGMKSNDLFDFMKSITNEMANEYDRIQKRATEDPGTAGDQGEENWATLLREWLPPTYHIVTKGRILSHEGIASPQIDVLVLNPSYPQKLLDKKVYLAGGVAVAFECKVTLKSAHIHEALKNSVEIRRAIPGRKGSPYKELHSPILYGLLAHSHSWKGEHSIPISNIESKLHEEDEKLVQHPREMLDIICVADLATWTSSRMTFFGPRQSSDWSKMADIYGKNGLATTAYICHSEHVQNQILEFTAIGAAISYLYQKLAWENQEARPIADYFRMANISGSGQGVMRMWGSEIYSDEIRQRVVLGQLSNGKVWDEWSVAFI